ncbi:MAG: hypothetical protein R2747_15290 [Pyrinomonadaceae bacterium]
MKKLITLAIITTAFLLSAIAIQAQNYPKRRNGSGSMSYLQVKSLAAKSVRDIRRDFPWATPPENAQYKLSLVIEFTDPINTSTLCSGRTFQITIDGKKVLGSFNFSKGKKIAIFYGDENKPNLEPGQDLVVFVRIKGSYGPITDRQGNKWAFSGVHRLPQESDSGNTTNLGGIIKPRVNQYLRNDLLDGNKDGSPGGDFIKRLIIKG